MRYRSLNLLKFIPFAALLVACAAPPAAKQTSFKYEVAPFSYSGSDWKRDLVSGLTGYSEITPKPGNTFPLGAYQFETIDGEGRLVYRVLAYGDGHEDIDCLLYTSPSPRDLSTSRMPSSA